MIYKTNFIQGPQKLWVVYQKMKTVAWTFNESAIKNVPYYTVKTCRFELKKKSLFEQGRYIQWDSDNTFHFSLLWLFFACTIQAALFHSLHLNGGLIAWTNDIVNIDIFSWYL